jgi:hypothetical protein
MSLWVRANLSTPAGFAGIMHCKDPASNRPSFVLGFDRATNKARYAVYAAGDPEGALQPPTGAVEEDGTWQIYAGSWVHYAIVHVKHDSTGAPNASMYRDGVLVGSAQVPYEWAEEEMECAVGSSSLLSRGFLGDVLMFYLWQGALTQLEIAYTRQTGTPHHVSESSVSGVMGSECRDIDECALRAHVCQNASCVNTVGSYACSGPPLHRDDDEVLVDVDECAARNHACEAAANTTCVNTLGSFYCMCTNGSTYNVSLNGSRSIRPPQTRLGARGLSISLWTRCANSRADVPQALLECTHPVLDIPYFLLTLSTQTDVLMYTMYNNIQHSSIPARAAQNGMDLPCAWTHFALVHSSSNTLSMYRNGIQVRRVDLACIYIWVFACMSLVVSVMLFMEIDIFTVGHSV